MNYIYIKKYKIEPSLMYNKNKKKNESVFPAEEIVIP